jgi:hypothetical protein
MDTGGSTGTLGMTIDGKWDHIDLDLRVGNVIVNYSGADNPDLNLRGSCDTLDINSTAVIGVQAIKATTGITSAATLTRIVSNLADAFFAYTTANQDNVTGNGAVYTVLYDAEQYDLNSSMDISTGIATCKVAGLHLFSGAVCLDGLAAGNTLGILRLLHRNSGGSSVNTLDVQLGNVGAMRDSGDAYTAVFSSPPLRMAEGDTFRVQVQVTGGGGDTVDIIGTAGTRYTWLGGKLLA